MEKTADLQQVHSYINRRYPRFMDYANFHCKQANIHDPTDVLHTVLLSLLQKDKNTLIKLYQTKRGQYKVIDFMILRMIKLNVYSPTSPYRWKNKILAKDDVDFSRLKIVDVEEEQEDKPAIVLKEMRLIRYVFSAIKSDLSEIEKKAFEFRFIQGESFKSWPGPELYSKLDQRYHFVADIIHGIIKKMGLTQIEPKKITRTQKEIVDRFFLLHKVHITKSYFSEN